MNPKQKSALERCLTIVLQIFSAYYALSLLGLLIADVIFYTQKNQCLLIEYTKYLSLGSWVLGKIIMAGIVMLTIIIVAQIIQTENNAKIGLIIISAIEILRLAWIVIGFIIYYTIFIQKICSNNLSKFLPITLYTSLIGILILPVIIIMIAVLKCQQPNDNEEQLQNIQPQISLKEPNKINIQAQINLKEPNKILVNQNNQIPYNQTIQNNQNISNRNPPVIYQRNVNLPNSIPYQAQNIKYTTSVNMPMRRPQEYIPRNNINSVYQQN